VPPDSAQKINQCKYSLFNAHLFLDLLLLENVLAATKSDALIFDSNSKMAQLG